MVRTLSIFEALSFSFTRKYILLFLGVMLGNAKSNAQEIAADFVLVESRDAKGLFIAKGIGVVQRDGYVLCNYHLVAGGREIRVSAPGSQEFLKSDGYLNVIEKRDLVSISVPGLKGRAVPLYRGLQIPNDAEVVFAQTGAANSLSLRRAVTHDLAEVNGITLVEAISKETDECISGPVFLGGELAGFVTAGYYDGKYYLYISPARPIFAMMGSSFIIKSFDSFDDEFPIFRSSFQTHLLDQIDKVIWLSFEDAVRLARKNNRKIIVDICTNWNGWCNMMDNQVYNQLSVIKYINENFYAVRLNAESKDSIWYQGRLFTWSKELRSHQLAYSLLEGKMTYPGTAFLDEQINLLTVVPGFMDLRKMKVALHFFHEEAYRQAGMSFEKFEANFREDEH